MKNIFGDTKILAFYIWVGCHCPLKNNGRVSDFVYYSSKIDYFSVKWTIFS